MKTFHIDGPIGQGPGEISALSLKAWLPTTGEDITVSIHSEGGAVFEGFAIHDILKAYAGRVVARVESMAFSAAAIVALAADEIEVTPSGYLMVHNSSVDDGDLGPSQRDLLASLNRRMTRIVCERTGKPEATVRNWMTQELFFDAEAAVAAGLADRIASPSRPVTARMIPARVLAKLQTANAVTAREKWLAAIDATGLPRAAAIMAVERKSPALRQAMLAEANTRTAAAAKPVAVIGATAKWKAAVNAKIAAGVPRAKAIMQVEHDSPGLRLAMLQEANRR